jgi:lipoprotein-anchoring transpeptidase ErfK/SrfK
MGNVQDVEKVVTGMRLSRPLSRGAVMTACAAGAVGVAGVVLAAVHLGSSSPTNSRVSPSNGTGTVVDGQTQVAVVGLRNGRVPWNKPVTLQITNGKLRTVAVNADGSGSIDGTLSSGDTVWTSAETLVPLARYQANVSFEDAGHHTKTLVVDFKAADAAKHLKVTLSPGDGNTVGVGSPIIASFSRPVPNDERAMVEARLAVSVRPSVVGAWHWMSDQEVHWRPPKYWKRGTAVTVSADLNQLYLGKGVWGSGKHATSFHIGDSHVSRVDVARHMMYVYRNGALVRSMPISAGRDKYPTKNGVHITFEKSQLVTMDSATVGIPRNSPDGYYEKVYWDVRISYGGAFVHAAPWSVGEQGRVNVSHGCVNLSTANATWFYYFSQRGDIVDVYNSGAAPDTADPGMADWNMSWANWVAGDAAPSAAAQRLTPKMPRDYEPGAPGYSSSTSSYSTTHRSTPAPKPTYSRRPSPSPKPTGH